MFFCFCFSALFSLFLYEHFCVSCFSPFRLGWQGGWQGGLARRELARGGGLVLGVKELRLGDTSSKVPFAVQFANSKIVDKQRVFRYHPKNNQNTERKNIDKRRSKRQVGERLAKCWQNSGNKLAKSWAKGVSLKPEP